MTIDNQWSVLLQVLIFLGVVANIAYAALKRKWEVQDIDRKASEVKLVAEVEAEKVRDALALHNAHLQSEIKLLVQETAHREALSREREKTAMQRDEAAAAQRAMLVLELAKNTALTKEVGTKADTAYKEANSANAKIAETNQRAVAERQEDQKTAEHTRDAVDNLQDMAQQYMVQQAPGGERALPAEPAAEQGKAEPLRGPHQDEPT